MFNWAFLKRHQMFGIGFLSNENRFQADQKKKTEKGSKLIDTFVFCRLISKSWRPSATKRKKSDGLVYSPNGILETCNYSQYVLCRQKNVNYRQQPKINLLFVRKTRVEAIDFKTNSLKNSNKFWTLKSSLDNENVICDVTSIYRDYVTNRQNWTKKRR